jgi:hypothetical protein
MQTDILKRRFLMLHTGRFSGCWTKTLYKMHKRRDVFLYDINEKSKNEKIVKKIQKNLDFFIPM